MYRHLYRESLQDSTGSEYKAHVSLPVKSCELTLYMQLHALHLMNTGNIVTLAMNRELVTDCRETLRYPVLLPTIFVMKFLNLTEKYRRELTSERFPPKSALCRPVT